MLALVKVSLHVWLASRWRSLNAFFGTTEDPWLMPYLGLIILSLVVVGYLGYR